MAEDEEAAALLAPKQAETARPEDAEWPAWAGTVRIAWAELRHDRHIGAMGGIGHIYFTAIDRYAERFGITGHAFDDLLIYLRAMDEEYVAHVMAMQEAERNKARH
jgi:hypothetical protein